MAEMYAESAIWRVTYISVSTFAVGNAGRQGQVYTSNGSPSL